MPHLIVNIRSHCNHRFLLFWGLFIPLMLDAQHKEREWQIKEIGFQYGASSSWNSKLGLWDYYGAQPFAGQDYPQLMRDSGYVERNPREIRVHGSGQLWLNIAKANKIGGNQDYSFWRIGLATQAFSGQGSAVAENRTELERIIQDGVLYRLDSIYASYLNVNASMRLWKLELNYMRQYRVNYFITLQYGGGVWFGYAPALRLSYSAPRYIYQEFLVDDVLEERGEYAPLSNTQTFREELIKPGALGFGLQAPLQFSTRLGSKKPFWRSLSAVVEIKPGFHALTYQQNGLILTPYLYQGIGLQYSLQDIGPDKERFKKQGAPWRL